MMRFAGEVLQKLHGLGAAAIISPVAVGRQVKHGRLVYDSIPELWRSAVDYTIDGGLPLTAGNIRQSAETVIAQRETMIEEELGVNYDALGRLIERETSTLPLHSRDAHLSQGSAQTRVQELLKTSGFDASLAVDPNFPF